MEIGLLLLFSIVMLKIAYVDYKEQYIYDVDIGVAGMIALAYSLCTSNLYVSIVGGICGFAIGYVIYVVAKMVYGEESFGFGDVILLGVMGIFFGYPMVLHYFANTIMITGFIAMCFLLYDSSVAKMAVPMAPIFIAGAFLQVWNEYPTVYDFLFNRCIGILSAFYHLILNGLSL